MALPGVHGCDLAWRPHQTNQPGTSQPLGSTAPTQDAPQGRLAR